MTGKGWADIWNDILVVGWYIAWLGTSGWLGLGFWQTVLALPGWPYFLAAHLAGR